MRGLKIEEIVKNKKLRGWAKEEGENVSKGRLGEGR